VRFPERSPASRELALIDAPELEGNQAVSLWDMGEMKSEGHR
jgi:hypothetical protein